MELLKQYLREQADLSAVEIFSEKHSQTDKPLQEKFYRDLIPSEKLEAGEQYAFEVNLDTCTGCKACVASCHQFNGLNEKESWRKVAVNVGLDNNEPIIQHTTSSCHHCIEPGCLEGCPVQAYEKDKVTGIVQHLDDQCIGCRYCEMKCPYEVPQYQADLGIVRKCDMCINRLREGEAPACVQSCPNGAIKISKVNQEEAKSWGEIGFENVPESPSAKHTLPTTKYIRNGQAIENVEASRPEVQHAHWPLVWMLILTQASLGLLAAAYFNPSYIWLASAAGLAGMAIAPTHLGRPLQAWKAFLGWKTSWLSREMLVFGPFAGGLAILPLFYHELILGATVFHGIIGVFCSSMIYRSTPRPLWDRNQTIWQFFSTSFIFASMGIYTIKGELWIAITTIALMAVKLISEIHLINREEVSRSKKLLTNDLIKEVRMRHFFMFLSAILIFIEPHLALFALLCSETTERFLFFSASLAPSKPENN